MTNTSETGDSVSFKLKKKINPNTNNNNSNKEYGYFVNETLPKGFCLNLNEPNTDLSTISNGRQILGNNSKFNISKKLVKENR